MLIMFISFIYFLYILLWLRVCVYLCIGLCVCVYIYILCAWLFECTVIFCTVIIDYVAIIVLSSIASISVCRSVH